MGGACTTCGRVGPLEAHHVAGRANHPTLIVEPCLECHRVYLTAWQRAAGVNLRSDPDRSEVDRLRALAVGALDVLALAWQRECSCRAGLAADCRRTGRAFSRLLDAVEPADRAGRWTPDPRAALPVAAPVAPEPGSEPDRVAGLAALMWPLVLARFGDDHLSTRAVAAIRRDPGGCVAGWEAFVADPAQARQAADLLASFTGQIPDAVAALAGLAAAPWPEAADGGPEDECETPEALPAALEEAMVAVRALRADGEQLATLLAAALELSGPAAADASGRAW